MLEAICALEHPEIEILPEPIEEWKDWNGVNILKMFYKEPAIYGFQFQLIVANTLVNRQLSRKNDDAKVVFMERSLLSSLMFAHVLKEDMNMTELEFKIIKEWMETAIGMESSLTADATVYIQCAPTIAMKKIKQRGRKEEADIHADYLSAIESLHHDHFVMGRRRVSEIGYPYGGEVKMIDGSRPIDDVEKEAEAVVQWAMNLARARQ